MSDTENKQHERDDSAPAPVEAPPADREEAVTDESTDTADPGPGTGRRFRIAKPTARAAVMGLAALVVALAVSTGVLGFLYAGKSDELAGTTSRVELDAKAQQVAMDYATGAAMMDYQDLAAWNEKLVAGTSPELKQKLTEAASSMEQVIVPLQWVSTSRPISAQVTERNGDVYTVAAFVDVNTRNAQSPDGVQSTAAYTVTVDRSKGWQITDVGGVDPRTPK